MVVTTFIVKLRLKMILINVTGDIIYRIKGDMGRIHPQVKKPFIMAHTRLVWFNSYRHNQMRWLTFSFFSPNGQGAIGHLFKNTIRYEILEFQANFVIFKNHFGP